MKMKTRVLFLLSLLSVSNLALATYIPSRIKEKDNSPNIAIVKIKVSNGKLTSDTNNGIAMINFNGDITSAETFADNALIRADGSGKAIQASGILIDDSKNVTEINNLTLSGRLTSSTFSMPTNPSSGYILKSDASGNATWVQDSSIQPSSDELEDLVTNQSDSLFAGNGSGLNNSGITYSTAVGINSLMNNINEDLYNSALGFEALKVNINNQNSAFGYKALTVNTSGINGTALGYQALKANITGFENTAFGSSSSESLINGNSNLSIGKSSLRVSSDDNQNTGIGEGTVGTNGSEAVAIGYYALQNNTSNNNTATGSSSLQNNTTGTKNSALGRYALTTNTTGSENTAFGYYSIYNNSATQKTGFGVSSAYNTATGSTGVGGSAAYSTGGMLTGVGYYSLYGSTASNNSALGYYSGTNNTSGTGNSSLGTWSGYLTSTGTNNTSTGQYSLYLGNSTGSTSSGYQALSSSSGASNTSSGSGASSSNSSGTSNTALGMQSLQSNSVGSYNTTIGHSSLKSGTSSGYHSYPGYNTSIGRDSLKLGTTSSVVLQWGISFNTIIGEKSAYNLGYGSSVSQSTNLFFGHKSGYLLTNSSSDILIGYQAGDNLSSGGGYTTIGANVDSNSAMNIGNIIYRDSSNIGINKSSPSSALDINGAMLSTGFKLSTSAASNYLIVSNASGTGTWTHPISAYGTEWSDGTSLLYPYDSSGDQHIVIGNTTEANADIDLEQTGKATFNEQGNLYDLRIEGDTADNLIYTKASNNRVGIGTNAPTSKLHVEGSIALPITSVSSSSYTVAANDYTVVVNCSSSAVTINLPTASGITGRIYVIKKIDNSANAVTLDGLNSQTIDGTTTYLVEKQYEAIIIQSTGSNWIVI